MNQTQYSSSVTGSSALLYTKLSTGIVSKSTRAFVMVARRPLDV